MRRIAGYHPLTLGGDILGLGLIAALLVAIHVFVPGGLQEQFVFRHSLTRGETLLTSAYLHLTDEHLYSNLAGFALAAAYTYMLAVWARERRWFWLTTLTLLVVLPILVNLTSMVVWEVLIGLDLPPARGFSGVVAGFVGFLAVAALVFLRTAYSRGTVRLVGQFILLVILAELLVIYADSSPVVGGVLVLIAIGLVGVGLVHHAYPEGVPEDRRGWARLIVAVLQLGLVLVALSALIYGLFPVDLVEEGTLTNVVAHMSGVVWGVVIARWGYRYWCSE